MGDVGVLVGDSSVLNEKGLPIFKQCGNTIKVNRQMPNGEQPVLFQAVGSHSFTRGLKSIHKWAGLSAYL